VAAIRSQGFGYVPTLLLNDPPAHTRYRRMVQRALTPRALAWMEPLIADVAAGVESCKARGVKFHGGIEDTPICHMAFGEDTEGNGFILHRRK